VDVVASTTKLRLVILVSGVGSLMNAVVEATRDPHYPAEIVAVGADRPCEGLTRAESAGIETFLVNFSDYANRAEWDEALATTIARYQPDLIVSAGFMRIAGKNVLKDFGGRFINTHPALLPAFKGAHAVEDALAYGVKYTGSSIHLVDEEPVPVLPDDTVEALHDRIKIVERRLLCEVIADIATDGPSARVTRIQQSQ